MKHLNLYGDTVFEIFEKDGKTWCKRTDSDGIICNTLLNENNKVIISEVPNKQIFMDYVYFYGRNKAYDKLKEINFKFE